MPALRALTPVTHGRLSPETKAWVAAIKQSLADGDLADEAMDGAEAVRRLEDARRDLTA